MKLVKDLGMIFATKKSKTKKRYGMYECECGRTKKVNTNNVKRGLAKKCKHCGNIKHGDTGSRLYGIWGKIKDRCENKKCKAFPEYGGRGVGLFKEWKNYENFKKWAVENGYEEKLTIDRKNNDGNYEPSNCRWVTQEVQSRNQRKIRSTNTSGYKGVGKQGNKWRAKICVSGKQIHIGYFDKAVDAAITYDNYIKENRLEHTRNFSD